MPGREKQVESPSGEVGLGGSKNREEESEAVKVGDAVGGLMGLGKDLGLNSNSDGNSTLGFEQETNTASIQYKCISNLFTYVFKKILSI